MALQILLWLVVVILALIVPLLILPVRIELSLQKDPVGRAMVQLRPFGGAFPAFAVFDSTKKRAPRTPKSKARKKRNKGKVRVNSSAVRNLPAVIGRAIKAVHFEHLRIDVDFGLGDPADTGQVFGQLTPLIYASNGRVALRPNFDRACLTGSAMVQLRVIPIVFLWPFLGLLWHMFGPFR